VRIGLGGPETGPDVSACITATCLAEAARGAQAQQVLAVEVAVTGEFNDQFAITVVIADHQGRALRRREGKCPTCAIAEATEHVTALVSEIVAAATNDSVAVEITTSPVSAPIAVDGVDRGRAPWKGTLPAGSHHVVSGGVDQTFFVEAIAAGAPPHKIDVAVPTAGGGRKFGWITYATAGAGAAAVIGGAVLLARDGDPTCPTPSCPYVHDTATAGWLTLGVGVAALGAAGYMFWHDRKADRPTLIVAPTADGATAALIGRF
jgi:hypothetical protein